VLAREYLSSTAVFELEVFAVVVAAATGSLVENNTHPFRLLVSNLPLGRLPHLWAEVHPCVGVTLSL
jgi:hypothetical protein